MIRAYVGGQRQRYTNPVTYLFIGAGLALLVWHLLGEQVLQQMRQQAGANVSPFHLSAVQSARYVEMHMWLADRNQQLTLLICLPLTLLFRLLFRHSSLNLAEHFIFATFVMGQFNLLMTLIHLVAFPLH